MLKNDKSFLFWKSFPNPKNSKMEDILYRYNVCYLKGEINGSRVWDCNYQLTFKEAEEILINNKEKKSIMTKNCRFSLGTVQLRKIYEKINRDYGRRDILE